MENNDDEYEYEFGYPLGQITQTQARQLLAKRYWNWDKITAWVESLPQIQELKKSDKKTKDEE